MKRYLDQIERKEMKEGDLLFDAPLTDHLFLFVLSGTLQVVVSECLSEIRLPEGHFIFLNAGYLYQVTALTTSRTLMIKTTSLPEGLARDPDWSPVYPIVLPIFPILARKLRLIELEYQQRHMRLN